MNEPEKSFDASDRGAFSLEIFLVILVLLVALGLTIPWIRASGLSLTETTVSEHLQSFSKVLSSEPLSRKPAWNRLLAPPLGTGSLNWNGEASVQGEILHADGYLFRFAETPEGVFLYAWPQEYGVNGHASFAWRGPKGLFECRNDRRRYSGTSRMPQDRAAVFAQGKEGERFFGKDAQEWRSLSY